MINSKIDRRSDIYRDELGNLFDGAVITEGLVVQKTIGAVSAIEYLKSKGVSAPVIQRVLSGGAMRLDDTMAVHRLS